MNVSELNALKKQIIQEMQQEKPISSIDAIAGAQLPTFDISAAAGCCEGHCPCDSRNGGTCPCASKCGCDGKVTHRNDLDWVSRLAQLEQSQITNVLDAAPIIHNLRFAKDLKQ